MMGSNSMSPDISIGDDVVLEGDASLEIGKRGCEKERWIGAGGCKDARFGVLESRFSDCRRT